MNLAGACLHDLSDRKENGTANHANHAKGGGALQGQDDAFDLKARLAEVEQQAEMQARGIRAQPMIRLDRRLILSTPISICVFCVFCGSIFLSYCRHNLSDSLTQQPQEPPTSIEVDPGIDLGK
jgi:hypothetical protein